MSVNHVKLLVASSGTMRVEQADTHVFKVMRAGSVDSYLGHLTTGELRDLFDAVGDLITFLDTPQPVSEVA